MRQVQCPPHCRDWSCGSESCSSPQSGLEQNTCWAETLFGKVRSFLQNTSGLPVNVVKCPIRYLSNAGKILWQGNEENSFNHLSCFWPEKEEKHCKRGLIYHNCPHREDPRHRSQNTDGMNDPADCLKQTCCTFWSFGIICISIPSPSRVCLFRSTFHSVKFKAWPPLMTSLIKSILW